jgi:RNA-directed DNA polymerase
MLRGWANYLRHGVFKATVDYRRCFTWRRVLLWIRHNHPPSELEMDLND